jgi:hypothetical protein
MEVEHSWPERQDASASIEDVWMMVEGLCRLGEEGTSLGDDKRRNVVADYGEGEEGDLLQEALHGRCVE